MRQLLAQSRQNPDQKLKAIRDMAQELFKVEKWKDWDIQIEAEPQSLESRTLDAPEIL